MIFPGRIVLFLFYIEYRDSRSGDLERIAWLTIEPFYTYVYPSQNNIYRLLLKWWNSPTPLIFWTFSNVLCFFNRSICALGPYNRIISGLAQYGYIPAKLPFISEFCIQFRKFFSCCKFSNLVSFEGKQKSEVPLSHPWNLLGNNILMPININQIIFKRNNNFY